MTNRKNHNSILVLATVGVYLGLVLVGATPQVLAQAAMTKQFNVKDEVEVKDDLDEKPENADDLAGQSTVGREQKVATSVNRFLSQFRVTNSGTSLFASPRPWFELKAYRELYCPAISTDYVGPEKQVLKVLTVSNLPRADLDPSLAYNA